MVKVVEEDKRAVTLLALYDQVKNDAVNFRTLYQDVANLVHPRMNQITTLTTQGEDKYTQLADPVAVEANSEMASGLSQNLIPLGQPFFIIQASMKELNEIDRVSRYMSYITDVTHEKLFISNFATQFNETLLSLGSFGTSCIFSEFDIETGGLNFRDYDIGSFYIEENAKRRVNTVWLSMEFTAKQAND